MTRKIQARESRENALRDPVWAGLAGSLCTPQTQLRGSNKTLDEGFSRRSGPGAGTGAAVSAHCSANKAGALSRNALCGRTRL